MVSGLFDSQEDQKDQKMHDKALSFIGVVAKTPMVKVDREQFLRQQFADSPYLEQVLQFGPQSVYETKVLKKKAYAIVRNNTTKTSAVSFAAGLPANLFVAFPAAGADIIQYFAFAMHMAQQIAYLFGEDDLFKIWWGTNRRSKGACSHLSWCHVRCGWGKQSHC